MNFLKSLLAVLTVLSALSLSAFAEENLMCKGDDSEKINKEKDSHLLHQSIYNSIGGCLYYPKEDVLKRLPTLEAQSKILIEIAQALVERKIMQSIDGVDLSGKSNEDLNIVVRAASSVKSGKINQGDLAKNVRFSQAMGEKFLATKGAMPSVAGLTERQKTLTVKLDNRSGSEYVLLRLQSNYCVGAETERTCHERMVQLYQHVQNGKLLHQPDIISIAVTRDMGD